MIDKIKTSGEFVTTAQAAKILSVSVATLKKFIYQGQLRSVRTPGGHFRILKKDLFEKLYQNVSERKVADNEKINAKQAKKI